MISRKFGADIQNLVKEKSSNHIVLKSRSFSFDGKSKAPSHITRKTSFADEKPPIHINKTMVEQPLITQKSSSLQTMIQNDQQLVPLFLKQCIQHMRSKQAHKKLPADQIKLKNPYYWSKRASMIDWVVNLHNQLKLFPQTLFMAVSYMDQFSSKATLADNELQLLGASCILIAGKFQETYRIPYIRNIQQLTDQLISRQDMIKMEERIMEELDFSLIVDTPIKYLELYTRLNNLSDKNFYIAQYILELSLTESGFMEFSSSILGSSVIYLVNKIRKISPAWPPEFKELTGYDENQLKNCAKNLCTLLEKAPDMDHVKNIRSKFSKPEYCAASQIRLQRKNQ